MIRKILVLALIMILVSPLAACGRKSAPEPPPDSEYPREYPVQ